VLRSNKVNTDALAALIEHYGRLIEASCFVHGLTPAQWSFLRYINRANESARTVSAFALFHGTTKSAASQTSRVLQNKGLIEVMPSTADPRSKRLELSAEGIRFLAQDPLGGVQAALNTIAAEKLTVFAEVLASLVKESFKTVD
jgi:DNA-binding MarR family transcriptional regulator